MKHVLFSAIFLIGSISSISKASINAVSELDCVMYNGDSTEAHLTQSALGDELFAKLDNVEASITAWDGSETVFNINLSRDGCPIAASVNTLIGLSELIKATHIPGRVTLIDLIPNSKQDEITVSCQIKR